MLSKLKINYLRWLYSQLTPRDNKMIKDEYEKMKTLDTKIEKSYDPLIFKLFNSW